MSESKSSKNKIDFDELLNYIGGWGRFQITLLVMMIQFTFFLAYVGYSPILYLYVPDHWCSIPQDVQDKVSFSNMTDLLDVLIPYDENIQKRSQCYMYDVSGIDDPNDLLNTSMVVPLTKCTNGWTYNFTGYFHSASTEFDWVCDDAWKPAFTQSIFYAGAIIGTLIFGWISDHYGRYGSFISSNLVLMVTGIATPFANNFICFTAIRFLMGTSFITFFMSLYMLTLEYVSKEKRSLVGNLSLAIAMSLGGCIQPWILKAVEDWKIFHHILFCQTALIFIAPWFVKESSRWLITKGRIDEALIILQEIAKTNGKDVSPEVFQTFKASAVKEFEKSKETNLSWLDLFKSPVLRRNVVLMIINWSLTSVIFDGHLRNIENLKFSIYWTFTISSMIEFPSDLLAIWGLDLIGRKWSAVISLLGFFFTMFISTLVFDNFLLVTIFAMIGRFFITYSMNTSAQISLEVVPTQLRGQGTALANVFAQISNFFAPQIVYSKVVDERLPFLLLGAGALVASVFAVFLPETAGVNLPDTVEEAENLFETQGCIPCRKYSSDKKAINV